MNACAWNEAPTPVGATATPISVTGETRVHRFRQGDRIIIEISLIDPETYRPVASTLYIVPYWGDFIVRIRRDSSKPSHVILPIVPTDPNAPLFQTPTPGGPSGDSAPASLPATATPAPLTLEAYLYPDFTNPGGWRSWAPEVQFACRGGTAPVTCPQNTILLSDGANQTFTFEARDEAGNVATVTLTGISIDRTPPQFTENLPETQTFCSGATLPMDFSVSDALSGLASSQAGETAIMDRHDIVPRSVERAGGKVEVLGAPVDPGNLLMLAYLDGVPILGAPGCARSRKVNVVDWVLPRLLAGDHLTRADLMTLGHGGLLEDAPERPMPRGSAGIDAD